MDFTCKGCSLSFKDQFAFVMHFFTNLCVANQNEGNEFCSGAEVGNGTVLDLKHLRSEGNNVCEVCGKCCWPFESLAKHIFTHVGAMPYFCPFCHFSSLSKLHLLTHISRHASRARNENQKFPSKLHKAHVCDLCRCAFTDWKDLALHYVKHLKEAPFKCSICFMMFLEKRDFIIHRHLHKVSTFCEFCKVSFHNRVDCLEHVLTHNKSKMFRKFSLIVPYERLMRLKVNWYRDFFLGSSNSDQSSLGNPCQSHNSFAEENESAHVENHKEGKLVFLNCPSTQIVSQQPPALSDYTSTTKVGEDITALSKAALENQEKDELLLGLPAKPLVSHSSDFKNTLEGTVDHVISNGLKPSSKNELNTNNVVFSDVCEIETESTKLSLNPMTCSNIKLKLKKPFVNLVKLPSYVQDIESYRNFNNLQSQNSEVNLPKLPHQKNFKSVVLNKKYKISERRSIHEKLNKKKIILDNFYSPQLITRHYKPVFDYSKPNNYKNDDFEIRENVSHLCEVIFEEEDVSHDCRLYEKFNEGDSVLEKTPEESVNFSILSSNYETLFQKKWDFISALAMNNNCMNQQLNCCENSESFSMDESTHEVGILSSVEKESIFEENSNDQMTNGEICGLDFTCDKQISEESLHFSYTFQAKNHIFDPQTVSLNPITGIESPKGTLVNKKLDNFKDCSEAQNKILYSPNYWRKPSKTTETEMNHWRKPSKTTGTERNHWRKPSKTTETEMNHWRKPSKTTETELNHLVDMVRNLKQVFVSLDKLPSYVHDMPSFRKFIKAKENKNRCWSLADRRGSKLSGQRRRALKVKKAYLKNYTLDSNMEKSSSHVSTFSDSSSSTDVELHPVHRKLQRRRPCGPRKTGKTDSEKKRTSSKLLVKSSPPNNEDSSSDDDDSSEDYPFSVNCSLADAMLHHSYVKLQRPSLCGTRKTNQTKKTASKMPVQSTPHKTAADSSATETCPESFSDSSSGISDFMQRWLLGSKRNSNSSSPPKRTLPSVRAKKSVPKPCRKPPRRRTRKPQARLNSMEKRKPFVHLWRLPNSIYEKHLKCKPIMLSSLLPMIDKIEEFRQKQPDTSHALQDHNYCFPSVSSSILLEHNYC